MNENFTSHVLEYIMFVVAPLHEESTQLEGGLYGFFWLSTAFFHAFWVSTTFQCLLGVFQFSNAFRNSFPVSAIFKNILPFSADIFKFTVTQKCHFLVSDNM